MNTVPKYMSNAITIIKCVTVAVLVALFATLCAHSTKLAANPTPGVSASETAVETVAPSTASGM